ncbi:MAG: GNAT family N-acetyltransferase [Anaerolineae bacterium]|nr:GNAT family N-acetyltransferase [Anaerolineae bacterium]
MEHKVVVLQRDRRPRAAEMLAWAFQSDPLFVGLIPQPLARHRALVKIFGGMVGYARHYGEVLTTPEVRGVACWLPPGRTEVTPWRIAHAGLRLVWAALTVSQGRRKLLWTATQHTEAVHKRLMTVPHWYLWLLGVAPDRQGHGYGSALLRPILARADQEGTSCYLETQTERNVAFYRRRGFQVAEMGLMPGVDLPVWHMVRSPQG